jgi:SAM-dependent methyltransferase
VNALLNFRGHDDLAGEAWQQAEVAYILGQGHHTAADRILDVDCGRGGRVHAFAARGFEHVTGLDPEFDNLEPARIVAAQKALHANFVQGTPLHYPFPDKAFEEILMLGPRFGCGSSPTDDIVLLRESLRVLAPCGTLWFSVADGVWMRDHPWPQRDYPAHVADTEKCVVTEQGLTERLYGPCELTDVLYGLGFRAVSYRAHESGFAAAHHDAKTCPPRLLVRCRAPRPPARTSPPPG